VTVASSGISPIIPPSVIMVVYAVVAGVSIGKMFLGGVVPGLLMAGGQMVVASYIAKKRNYPKRGKRASFKEFLKNTNDAMLALVAPSIILVGILGGFFTPTEAGIVASAYALLLGMFVYKKIHLRDLPVIFWETIILSTGPYLLVGMSSISAWIITAENIPQQIATALISITTNKILILLLLNILFLIVGMLMEAIAAIIVLTPILLPVVELLGISPIHFGVILCVNLVIGFVTPPVGALLFIVSGIADISLQDVFKAVIPFIISNVIILVIITIFPDLVMFIPNLFLK
jgi:tripartite ATP-independent transporter DctM subunit